MYIRRNGIKEGNIDIHIQKPVKMKIETHQKYIFPLNFPSEYKTKTAIIYYVYQLTNNLMKNQNNQL